MCHHHTTLKAILIVLAIAAVLAYPWTAAAILLTVVFIAWVTR